MELDNPNLMSNLINSLSSLLERLSVSNNINSSNSESQKALSVFNGISRPNISIQNYLDRIFKYANCSPSCFIVAYVYLDRFAQRQPDFPIDSFNVHRLIITSVMIAAKFMDDRYYNNAYYANILGISTIEMNFLEVDFLFGLRFNLNVTPTTFYTYYSYLQKEMMQQPSINYLSETFLYMGRSSKLISYHSEDETSHHQQLRLIKIFICFLVFYYYGIIFYLILEYC